MQSKFGKQLDLFLEGNDQVKAKDVAGSVPVSEGQLSRMRKGDRQFTKQSVKAIAMMAHAITVNYSAARANHGIISFMIRPGRTDDVLQAFSQQEEEEDDRENIQKSFIRAATTEPKQRSNEQRLLIKQFLKELIEEIGSEITLFIRCCKYLRVDPQPFIDTYNEKLGG